MRVLILGGTKYLGCHLAEQALQAGHDVTLFNRGRTGTELFPGVPRLIGDRTVDGDPAGLTALGTGSWDTVFDFSGFHPRQVAATAGMLAPRIGQYVFMSSIAVYPASAEAGRTEDAPLLPPESDDGEYGNLKVACEREAEAAMPGRATFVRHATSVLAVQSEGAAGEPRVRAGHLRADGDHAAGHVPAGWPTSSGVRQLNFSRYARQVSVATLLLEAARRSRGAVAEDHPKGGRCTRRRNRRSRRGTSESS